MIVKKIFNNMQNFTPFNNHSLYILYLKLLKHIYFPEATKNSRCALFIKIRLSRLYHITFFQLIFTM